MKSLTRYITDEWIKENRSFALYRRVGEQSIRLLSPDRIGVETLYDIEELTGKSGFVVAPFALSPACPLVLMRSEQEPVVWEVEQPPALCDDEPQRHSPIDPHYSQTYRHFLAALASKRFDKLVLSRGEEIARDPLFSPTTAFLYACQRYIYSYVYLCHTPQTGTWMGSTPELLLAGEKAQWQTVALAGTQPLQQGDLPQQWNAKNYREQQLVADYVEMQLAKIGIRSRGEGPYSVRAGELAHLKSDFRFELTDNRQICELLRLIHPTPAVCGMPKEDAYRFIQDNEGYDRRYYSGFVGWLHPEERTELYVNLRCMEMTIERLKLYAGGGLLSSSTLQEEWEETESKMATMRRIIARQ